MINNNDTYSYEDNEYKNIFSRFLPDDSATFVEFCLTADHQDIPLGSHLTCVYIALYNLQCFVVTSFSG